MNPQPGKCDDLSRPRQTAGGLYAFLASRAASVVVFAALFCTLAVKLFHCQRQHCINLYPLWILADIAVLLAVEVVLSIVCFSQRARWAARIALVAAAVVCTWSVMNAGWLIRTGTQILPNVLLPLVRDPLNALGIVGANLAKMPLAAVALLGPSAVALAFFFTVLARPLPSPYTRSAFDRKLLVSCIIILAASLAYFVLKNPAAAPAASRELRDNAQLRALLSLAIPAPGSRVGGKTPVAKRVIPTLDRIQLPLMPQAEPNRNVVVVVLEGVQYKYTSMADDTANLTPYLAGIALRGADFTSARSTLTHTTKVLFSILTGRYPSVSQDLAEAVPVEKPYAGLVSILERGLGYRTAFFQSAKGNFESRPGLIHNLGFDKFWARDDLPDSNSFIGSLGSDEFAMLPAVAEWLKADTKPFLLVILCSVTHDPYEVPAWFGRPGEDPLERYKQTIRYTDQFIAALDGEIEDANLAEDTIFCVIGDHGEAFGEHALLGHERIAFDEALKIPLVIRAPSLLQPQTKITQPTASVDFTPTLLALLGFNIESGKFDGCNALKPAAADRRLYFAGWLDESPAGFLSGDNKFIYYPANDAVFQYTIASDPLERSARQLAPQDAQKIINLILAWRANSIFRIDQQPTGQKIVFDRWFIRWNDRVTRKCSRL